MRGRGERNDVNERRSPIARADVFYFGSLVTILPGVLWESSESAEWVIILTLVALVVLPALAGTAAALVLAEKQVRAWPFVWAIVGAIMGAVLAFLSLFAVYDMALLTAGAVSAIAFVPSLVVAIRRDTRPAARAARVAAPIVMIAACLLLPELLDLSNGLQVYGLWSIGALPLAGAAILAPVSLRTAPPIED